MFRNLKIGNQIGLGFALVLVIMAVVSLTHTHLLSQVEPGMSLDAD